MCNNSDIVSVGFLCWFVSVRGECRNVLTIKSGSKGVPLNRVVKESPLPSSLRRQGPGEGEVDTRAGRAFFHPHPVSFPPRERGRTDYCFAFAVAFF